MKGCRGGGVQWWHGHGRAAAARGQRASCRDGRHAWSCGVVTLECVMSEVLCVCVCVDPNQPIDLLSEASATWNDVRTFPLLQVRVRNLVSMWRTLPLLVAACALIAPTAADDAEWIEFYDKASNKKAYYHSVTRESKWEAPEGAKIRQMSAEGTASAQRTGKPDQRGTVFFVLMLPIVLVFGGLGLLFHMASKEGLMQALKERAKKQRDRGQARA